MLAFYVPLSGVPKSGAFFGPNRSLAHTGRVKKWKKHVTHIQKRISVHTCTIPTYLSFFNKSFFFPSFLCSLSLLPLLPSFLLLHLHVRSSFPFNQSLH